MVGLVAAGSKPAHRAMASDVAFRKKLAENARKTILDNFTVEKMI